MSPKSDASRVAFKLMYLRLHKVECRFLVPKAVVAGEVRCSTRGESLCAESVGDGDNDNALRDVVLQEEVVAVFHRTPNFKTTAVDPHQHRKAGRSWRLKFRA